MGSFVRSMVPGDLYHHMLIRVVRVMWTLERTSVSTKPLIPMWLNTESSVATPRAHLVAMRLGYNCLSLSSATLYSERHAKAWITKNREIQYQVSRIHPEGSVPLIPYSLKRFGSQTYVHTYIHRHVCNFIALTISILKEKLARFPLRSSDHRTLITCFYTVTPTRVPGW
jgi:hypothetical protein